MGEHRACSASEPCAGAHERGHQHSAEHQAGRAAAERGGSRCRAHHCAPDRRPRGCFPRLLLKPTILHFLPPSLTAAYSRATCKHKLEILSIPAPPLCPVTGQWHESLARCSSVGCSHACWGPQQSKIAWRCLDCVRSTSAALYCGNLMRRPRGGEDGGAAGG